MGGAGYIAVERGGCGEGGGVSERLWFHLTRKTFDTPEAARAFDPEAMREFTLHGALKCPSPAE